MGSITSQNKHNTFLAFWHSQILEGSPDGAEAVGGNHQLRSATIMGDNLYFEDLGEGERQPTDPSASRLDVCVCVCVCVCLCLTFRRRGLPPISDSKQNNS